MNTTDKKIAEVLAKFGEPMAGNVWRVQGTAVIYHKALERIAAQAKIQFDTPTIVRAERDEAVILVTGRMGERVEWSIGEALIGVNYRVSGKQAAYVYAMAEKRAKDRVILKLIELHGLVYSEEEADEFRNSRPVAGEPQVEAEKADKTDRTKVEVAGAEGSVEAELKQKITKAKSINAVTDLMLHADTQKILNELPEGVRDEIRDFAKARLVELGWPTKKAA
ncbi:MAG TPA: trna delta -isopentenylpyrophosphate transferase [Microvirga sp.]|nr:trna delta -isopentenylpyrophosphate transferase [Microvirga sp.]